MKTVLAPNAPWYPKEKPKKKTGMAKREDIDKNFTKWANTIRLDCAKVFGEKKNDRI